MVSGVIVDWLCEPCEQCYIRSAGSYSSTPNVALVLFQLMSLEECGCAPCGCERKHSKLRQPAETPVRLYPTAGFCQSAVSLIDDFSSFPLR